MIVRDKPGVVQLLTTLHGSVLPHVIRPILVLTAFALVLTLVERQSQLMPRFDGSAYTVFGVGLSLFLGFRNSAAYDRWWEARKLWGGLLADLRSLAREAEIFIADAAERRALLRMGLGFLHAHRLNLRRLPIDGSARPEVAALAGAAHPPCAALDRMAAEVAALRKSGSLDGFGARTLSQRLGSMALQQAACERIANSPLPFVYSLLIYRTTYIYCLLLPLALSHTTGWLTPVFVAVVAYVFLGFAEVTEELSHPFATTANGLPLDAICRAAEISLAPHLGEAPPPPLLPVGHYLG